MTFIATNTNLDVVDTEDRYVSLVTTRDDNIAFVGSTSESGVVSFIATMSKQEAMDYWGDSPLTDVL